MKPVVRFTFIAVVATFAHAASLPAATSSASEVATSIAIVVRAADAGSKYLASEYARDLIHVLGGSERFAVIPRARVLMAEASQETPAEIGRTLAAACVLLAHVSASDDTFIFSAELIESRSKQKRWQETFRASLADGAAIPENVANAVARVLGRAMPTRVDRELHVTTANPAAWRAYLSPSRARSARLPPPGSARSRCRALAVGRPNVRARPGGSFDRAHRAGI